MKVRLVCIVGMLLAACGLSAVADPLGWFDKAPFEYNGNDFHDRIEFRVSVGKAGSAEAIVMPKVELEDDQLPRTGKITVNDKVYKFAELKDREGRYTLYASLPVEAIPVKGNFTFAMIVEDATGHRLVDMATEQLISE